MSPLPWPRRARHRLKRIRTPYGTAWSLTTRRKPTDRTVRVVVVGAVLVIIAVLTVVILLAAEIAVASIAAPLAGMSEVSR